MCHGAIPGKEIHSLKTCPSCGADLSEQVKKRLATLPPPPAPPPTPTSFFMSQAGFLSILAVCLVIVFLAVHIISTRQKDAARGNHTPDPARKGWSSISGK
jgi:hypothetical protein